MPSPRTAWPPNAGGQAVEGVGRVSMIVTSWPAAVVGVGDRRADPAAADDDDLHGGSSGIGSRTTQTSHGAFFRT